MTRSTVAQVSQIGVEVTPGTAVAATKRLGSLSISPQIQVETDPFRPAGLKHPTVQTLNREWSEAPYEGKPTYEEVIYPLSGAIDTATVSQVLDGATPTGAYEWVFNLDPSAADTPKTFTLEKGQEGVRAERFAHMLFTGFGLDISRAEVNMSGGGFARAAEQDFNMTDGLAIPSDLNPITPGSICLYMADTHAALESSPGVSDPANRLGRVITASPSLTDRFNPAWFVNCAENSFTTFVENAEGVQAEFPLAVEADDDGMEFLNYLRDGETKFLRIESLGPVIYNAGAQPNLRHLFQWDMAVKVGNADAWSDSDGIWGIPFTLAPFYDATWGRATSVKVRNTVAAL